MKTKPKYIYLSAESQFKSDSDAAKFENARKLDRYHEKISKEYFQENLPSILYNEGRTLIEDDTKVTGLVSKLDFFKKYPADNEAELKIETIRELSNEVFGVSIATKS